MGRRFFKHGELPLVLLALLSERRMNAYDLMSELGRLFAPLYRPSPGSVYPAVDALETEGLIGAADDGARTVYSLTAAGRAALEKRRKVLGELELRTGVRIAQRRSVDAALDRFSAEVHAVAPYLDPEMLDGLLSEAAAAIREHVPSSETGQTGSRKGAGR